MIGSWYLLYYIIVIMTQGKEAVLSNASPEVGRRTVMVNVGNHKGSYY